MLSTIRTPSSWKFWVMEQITEHAAARHTEIIRENTDDNVSQVTIEIVVVGVRKGTRAKLQYGYG